MNFALEHHVYPMNYHRFVLICFLICFPLLAACVSKEQPAGSVPKCISSDWPQDSSDLQPDPDITFGRLENGFRYMIIENKGPANRVGLFLNVQSGSLQETEEQRGFAHYLEHMMFNGTTHYPSGTLVEYFQSIGMEFGADTNAHTYFDKTVYRLMLPSVARETLEKGIVVLADYARGALLLEKEVDSERGVILAEKRAQDSAGYRVWEKQLQFGFSGTRVANRIPIGTEQTIGAATSDLLRSYYDSWYRPENMMVVVVGGMVKTSVVDLLNQHFSSLKAGTGKPACFDFGQVAEEGTDILYMDEPELGHTTVSIGTKKNIVPHTDTRAWREEQFKGNMATTMMANRLQTLTRKSGSPLTQAQVNSEILFQRISHIALTAKTEGENWQQGLEQLHYSLRQALSHGFLPAELIRAKKQFLAVLEKQLQTTGAGGNSNLAYMIIDTVNNNKVPISPQQKMELYQPMLDQLTLEQVNTAFKRLWEPKRRLLAVVGTANIGNEKSSAEKLIAEVYEANNGKQTAPWQGEEELIFPYLEKPAQKAEVDEWEKIMAIDTYSYTLANGTRVNIKKAGFTKNTVHLSIHFGQGAIAEPKPGLGRLAENVVNRSGFGQMNKGQLNRVLAGTNVEGAFKVLPESFSLQGGGLSAELELLLQLSYAQLHDPAFRESALKKSQEQFNQMYDKMENSVDGVQQLKGESFLAQGNRLYGVVARDDLNALSLADVEQWLSPVFAEAPFEINLVGDIDVEAALALITTYFGHRELLAKPQQKVQKCIFPRNQTLRLTVPTSIDKSLLTVAWKTDDIWDIGRTRRLVALASVFEDRLRRKIREELGATYSPKVFSRSSRVYEGFGLLRCQLSIDPRQAEMLTSVIKSVAEELVKGGISEDELLRVVEPTLTRARKIKRGSKYWLRTVLYLSSRHPEQLQWAELKLIDIASITQEELNALAREYLQPDDAAVVIVAPK